MVHVQLFPVILSSVSEGTEALTSIFECLRLAKSASCMNADAGGFLKSILVSGWNIWTINSTGIKVFADEGQHLQAEQTMLEQQRHLGDAAALAAALRSKVSELQVKVSRASASP